MEMNQLIKQAQGTNIETLLLAHQNLREPAEGELTDVARVGAKSWLRQHDLMHDERASGGFSLTHDGQQLAQALHRSRTNGERRWDMVARALAEAIDGDSDQDSVIEVDGAAVTDKERDLVLERLERWDLIKVLRAWGNEVVRVIAKPRLSEVFDVHGLLRDHYDAGRGSVDNSVTTNISGGNVGGVQAGGSGNTMHVSQTITLAERTDVLAKVVEIMAAVEAIDGAEELRQAVAAIETTAAEPSASKPRIKEKVLEAMAIAGATQGVETAGSLLLQLFSSIAG